jgi:hypothetical protein
MATLCPKCSGAIPGEDINVGKDVAFCRACDQAFSLSGIVAVPAVGKADLANPPSGTWYRDDGEAVVVGAVCRSRSSFMAIFAAVFWNSIVSVFLVGTLTGKMKSSGGGWVPPTWGMLLFLTPFTIIGVMLALAALMGLFGKVELRVRGSEAVLFRGIAGVGWRNRFDAAGVTGVTIRETAWKQNDQRMPVISLEGVGVKFGSNLSAKRRDFLAAALMKVFGR